MTEFHDVTFIYGEESSQGLEGVSLYMRQGETAVFCGEPGCGKSTVTRLIDGLTPHSHEGSLEGEALLDGRRVRDMQLYELSEWVGSVFQNPRTQFYNAESTTELAFGCENLGILPEEIRRRVTQTTERPALGSLLDHNLFTMPGGEKQWIACGSVDTTQPDVMALDEPSPDLDLFAIRDLTRVVQRWRDDSRTPVIAEHRIFYSLDIADRFIYIRDGRVEREFIPAGLRELTSEALAEFGLRTPEPWKLKPSEPQGESIETMQIRELECVTAGRRRLSIPELTLLRGEIIAVLGRNGAGKITLVRNLCALEKHGKRVFEIGGVSYNTRKRRELAYIVMRDVNHQLFTEDVINELLLSMGDSGSEDSRERVKETFQSLDPDGKVDRHPTSLSRDEKQWLAIGSVIIANKEVLILDEPMGGLDYRRMTEVADALRAMHANGKTAFVITHDIESVLRCCDHVIYLEAGKVTHSSRMDEDGVRHLREFFQ